MSVADETTIAEYVIEYYNWLTDNGGTSSDELLARPMSAEQRRLLLQRMDDVNVVFSATAPIHRAAGTNSPPVHG